MYQDDLSPYGRWFIHPRYGRCWIPYSTPYGWQPYTVGHWVYTSDGACCWVSEDREAAWGPIVYHYGQWEYTDEGWIWVPGTTWAPAWVAWRDGGGYCGWAPLPPEAAYQPQVTVVVVDRYCPPDRFVYVNETNITEVRVDQHIVRNNVTIINNTTNITNITVVNNRVVNRGVPVEDVERRTGRQVQRLNIAEATSPEDARRLAAAGQPVRYTSPKIDQVRKVEVAAQVHAQQEHDAQLQQQLTHDQQVGQKDQIELNNQEKRDQQLQQQTQAERAKQEQLEAQQKQAASDRQAQHDAQVQAQKQAEQTRADERAKQVAAQQEAARQKQAEHDQQVAAKQAQHDREVQQQKDAEAAREAAREKADSGDDKSQPKPGIKKPKPGQPGNEPPPQ